MEAGSRYIAVYFITVGIVTAWTNIGAASPPDAGSRPDQRYEETVLGYLRPALLAAKKVGRLYYVVPCKDPDHDFPVPFPDVKAQSPLNDRGGLETVRDIFRDDKRVTVSEEPDGIIKVRVGEVPAAILQTKIPLLRLKPLQQYNPTSAVFAITDTKAIQGAMRKLGLQGTPTVYSIPGNLPTKPAPHLPAVIKNVTLDQALDIVARTFGVIVVFGECTSSTGPSFMRVHTVYLQVD
jgi:hypothetical protein